MKAFDPEQQSRCVCRRVEEEDIPDDENVEFQPEKIRRSLAHEKGSAFNCAPWRSSRVLASSSSLAERKIRLGLSGVLGQRRTPIKAKGMLMMEVMMNIHLQPARLSTPLRCLDEAAWRRPAVRVPSVSPT
jgi:hypothetical protein